MFLKFDKTKLSKEERKDYNNWIIQFAASDKDNEVEIHFKFFIADEYQSLELGSRRGTSEVEYYLGEFSNGESNMMAN
jgi:hypothetical protein